MNTLELTLFWVFIVVICLFSLISTRELASFVRGLYLEVVEAFKIHPYLGYISGGGGHKKRHQALGPDEIHDSEAHRKTGIHRKMLKP